MAVRSNYIKNLMEQKNSLENQYQEVVTESMKSIIGESAKDGIRKLLKEADDEDSYTEEEVVDDIVPTDKEETDDATDEKETETDKEEETDTVDGDETESGDEDADDDELWKDLENCKSADGEYDCRGMDNGNLLKVLKAMGPEDGIRVISNGDGTATVEVDGDLIDGQQEFVIDFDDDDDEFEFELEEGVNESKNMGNTGYTDDYQGETAMTTPDNHEPADPKATYSMDGGVPTGTKKPWAGTGDTAPYGKNVNECGEQPLEEEELFEVEIDECGDTEITEGSMTVTQDNGSVRGVTKSRPTNSSSQETDRNGAPEGQSPTTGKGRGTGDGYKEANESIDFKRKVNNLFAENKQMKQIIPQLQEKINEAMVINASMGYIVRLLNENTTTVDEKKQISEMFTKVNTLEESKKLYESLSKQLNKVAPQQDVNKVINSQLAEGKQRQNLVETTVYRSEKVNNALDFMNRLDKIK